MNGIGALLSDSFTRAPWGWALLATVIVALIRIWPAMSRQAIEARAQLRKEKREDLGDCQKRLDEVSLRLDGMEEKFRQSELKLLGSISAYRILDVEVEAHIPGSTALVQARQVMSAAFTLSPSTDQRAAK